MYALNNEIKAITKGAMELEYISAECENGEVIEFSADSSFEIAKAADSITARTGVKDCIIKMSLFNDGENILRTEIDVEECLVKIIKISSCFKICKNYGWCFKTDGLWSGVEKVADIADTVINQNFCGLFDESGIGTTFMNKIPSKFYSEIRFEKKESGVFVVLETRIPHSFEGTKRSEVFNIAIDMPYTRALKNNAEKYAIEKDWESPVGWSSWDYYFTSVDEAAVRENTDFIANDEVLSKKIKYISIDDGWQQREGDWREGCRFPRGLERTAQYIKDSGFVPGIWISPLRLHILCGTVMRRNEFLLKDKDGNYVIKDEMFVLDPTHPDGERFLRETFTYLKEKGFDFFKLDYLDYILSADRFYNKNCGHYDALRRLLEIVRECVGEESHIMGCNLPYGTGGENINSRRTGFDIHNTWKNLWRAVRSYYPQFASHRRIYQNDIDYLVVRGKDTSDEEKRNVLLVGMYSGDLSGKNDWDFSYEEAKLWCTLTLASGTSVILGDRLGTLNETGLELVKTVLEYADFEAAEPLCNLNEIPEVWYKKSDNSLYFMNFSNEKREYNIEIPNINSEQIYFDIYTNKEYRTDKGYLKINIAPKESLALKCKRGNVL
ncbi:MAG: alpha-galactosidase [Clostridia bacterium]|nr:alpha-galactosidase [Clostridia bacterium]